MIRRLLVLLLILAAPAGAQVFGNRQWKTPVADVAALPATGNTAGDVRVAIATSAVYVWSGSAWVLSSGGGGVSAFTDLTDAPSSFSGQALRLVRVNAGETAVEFSAPVVDTDTTCLDAGVACLFAASLSEGGAASTATAATVDPANCSAGSAAGGVSATWTSQDCIDPITAAELNSLAALNTLLGTTIADGPHTTDTDDQNATEVPYTPTAGPDWVNPDPDDVADGLDKLAGRLTTEEAKADDDAPEAGDFGALSATSPVTQSGGTISTSVATNRLIGRTTAGTGVMEQLTPDATLSLAAGAVGVVDVTCTGCLGTTEIAALDAADVPTGSFGDPQVSDAITASSYAPLAGATFAGNVELANQKSMRFYEATGNGSNYLEFLAPTAITSNSTCTMENDGNPIPDSCVGNGADDVGTGDVVGPASSTNLSPAIFSGTTGKLLAGPSGTLNFLTANILNFNNLQDNTSTKSFWVRTGIDLRLSTGMAIVWNSGNAESGGTTGLTQSAAGVLSCNTTSDNNALCTFKAGKYVSTVSTLTIADNGSGANATGTLTPSTSYVEITCNDTLTGCDVTMSETGAVQGQPLTIVNVSANLVNFADTAGVSELPAGGIALGQYDTLELRYSSDRWIATSRSDN